MLLVPIKNSIFPVVLQQMAPPLLTMVPLLLQMVTVEAQEVVTQKKSSVWEEKVENWGCSILLKFLFWGLLSSPWLSPAGRAQPLANHFSRQAQGSWAVPQSEITCRPLSCVPLLHQGISREKMLLINTKTCLFPWGYLHGFLLTGTKTKSVKFNSRVHTAKQGQESCARGALSDKSYFFFF